jgi:hypothetical protein
MAGQEVAFYGFAFCAFGLGFTLGQFVTAWVFHSGEQ